MFTVYGKQNNYTAQDTLRFVSNEEADRSMAAYRAEKRLAYIKRYLRQRAERLS